MQHLTCEPANKPSRKSHETVGLDKLIEVNAQELHRDAEMTTEIEMFRHLDDMVFLILVLRQSSIFAIVLADNTHTHLRKLSRILISTRAWWWNLFLLRMILIATDSPVQ